MRVKDTCENVHSFHSLSLSFCVMRLASTGVLQGNVLTEEGEIKRRKAFQMHSVAETWFLRLLSPPRPHQPTTVVAFVCILIVTLIPNLKL